MGPWARIRWAREGRIADLEVLTASTEGLSFVLPPSAAAPPRPGELVHLLLFPRNGAAPAPARADVLEVVDEGGRSVVVCAFRAPDLQPDAHAEPPPELPREQENRREAFRVRPKAGDTITIRIETDAVCFEGWLLDVSARGVKLATASRAVEGLADDQPVRLSMSVPGAEAPLETEGRLVRTLTDARPYHCAIEFLWKEKHSELEALVVRYVMDRQREIIRMLRGPR